MSNRCDALARAGAAGLFIVALVAACGGSSAPSVTPVAITPAPVAITPAPVANTPAPTSAPATPVVRPSGPASLDAPPSVQSGAPFEVAWTGPNGQGDYVTIVKVGTAKWTNEPYFYTTAGSPGKLAAPTTSGAYELWYVVGSDGPILARRPIEISAFAGSLAGPATVGAGSPFTVAWTGPNGPGDYVTIVAVGATRWTNESYFYTNVGTPGPLVAPATPGAHELWYVTGADSKIMSRAPITVTPAAITLKAPESVAKGATFEVEWTGPNGPQDYITIAPAGSPDGTFLSYAYTATGSPVTLTAPTNVGAYEIRYASDRVAGTFGRIPILVK